MKGSAVAQGAFYQERQDGIFRLKVDILARTA
jgi:hypothetical protein